MTLDLFSNPSPGTILSLCDLTGTMTAPWEEAGYRVVRLDTQREPTDAVPQHDVRLVTHAWLLSLGDVVGVIAQPPCTHFASSGARWWKQKGDAALVEALGIVDACLRIIRIVEPRWWMLENPVGRLVNHIGPHTYTFQPHEYAGWLCQPGCACDARAGVVCDDALENAYTKWTCIWGDAAQPEKRARPNVRGSVIHRMPDSKGRANARSAAPAGFARAFFAANS